MRGIPLLFAFIGTLLLAGTAALSKNAPVLGGYDVVSYWFLDNGTLGTHTSRDVSVFLLATRQELKEIPAIHSATKVTIGGSAQRSPKPFSPPNLVISSFISFSSSHSIDLLVPSYGGFCAYAAAVSNELACVQPHAWFNVNNRLFFV